MNEAHRDTYRLGCKEIRMYIEKIKESKVKKQISREILEGLEFLNPQRNMLKRVATCLFGQY